MSLIIIFASILIIMLLHYVFLLRYLYHLRRVPGPRAWPLIANMIDIRMNQNQDVLKLLTYSFKKYGNFLKYHTPFKPIVLVADAKIAKFLLSHPDAQRKSANMTFLRKWLGTGLITGYGRRWLERKKIIARFFNVKNMDHYLATIDNKTNILIEGISKDMINNTEIEITHRVSLFTLEVVLETAMGIPGKVMEAHYNEYFKSVEGLCRIITNRSTSIFKYAESTFRFTKDAQMEKDYLKVVHGFSKKVIKLRKDIKNRNIGQGNVDKQKYALDLLLEGQIVNRHLTEDEIQMEVDSMIFGGHETTATTLKFILFNLAKHPEVQSKIYKEQLSIINQFNSNSNKNITNDKCKQHQINDDEITTQALNEMNYLDLVIKETLRLYPSTPIVGRHIFKDITLPNPHNTTIPAGSEVIISIYNLQRNAEYFEDALVFRPERFLSDECANNNYLPFGIGSRNCIGQKFANLELKCAIAKIVRHFELDLPASGQLQDENDLDIELFLKSKKGFFIKFKKRNVV